MPATGKELTERGRDYVKRAGVFYLIYTGDLIKVSYDMMGSKVITKARADGRVMIGMYYLYVLCHFIDYSVQIEVHIRRWFGPTSPCL